MKKQKAKAEKEFLPIEDEEDFEPIEEHGEEFSSHWRIFSLQTDSKKKTKARKKFRPPKPQNWEMPSLDLLRDPPDSKLALDEKIKKKSRLLTDKLAQFSVRGEVVGIKPGPQ